MTYDNNVNPFLLGPAKLQARLTRIRNMLVESLRKFNYKKITPELTTHLGAIYVGTANSGINEISAPPQRGRRRKRSCSPVRDGVIPGIERVSTWKRLPVLIRLFIKQSPDERQTELCWCSGRTALCVRVNGFV